MDEPQHVSPAVKAKEWGLTERRVRYLCSKHLVFRAFRDKKTGKWLIPRKAERPIDRRKYRYRKVPAHFRDLVQHVDVAVARIKAQPKMSPEESWRFFVRGSAFHMHTLGTSSFTFRNVCDYIDGKNVPGEAANAFEISMHLKALDLVRDAAIRKRRLSMTLVREIAKTLNGGRRMRCRSWSAAHDLAGLVQKTALSHNHPLIKAGDMLEGLFWHHPFVYNNEKIGYMLANFILMRLGYPPAIIYRIVFTTVVKYWQEFAARDASYKSHRQFMGLDLSGAPKPPVKFRAFLNACLSRAVLRSTRLGIGPVFIAPGRRWRRSC